MKEELNGHKTALVGLGLLRNSAASGKVLLTDPFIDYSNTAPIKSSELAGADYIALTHTHFDHCTDVGAVVKKFHSKVICSNSIAGPLAEFFDIRWTNLIRVRAGDIIKFDDLQVEVVRAEHIYMPITKADELNPAYPPPMDKMMPALIHAGLHQMPVRSMEMINFLFQTSDNLRLLMFGGVTSENQKYEIAKTHPNVAFFQTGSPEVVADFAALSGAELVIPYHHDTNPAKTHENAHVLAAQLAIKSKASFVDIQPGKWYEIGVKNSWPLPSRDIATAEGRALPLARSEANFNINYYLALHFPDCQYCWPGWIII